MFRRFLGLGFFNSPKGLLVRKKTSLPIAFGEIGFVSITTIALATYLGSWTFVISIIIVRFMVEKTSLPS
jgi:hypothetical protein